MKIIFLQPCDNGSRKFQPGDVAFLPDIEAEILIKNETAEMVLSRALGGLRLTVRVDQGGQIEGLLNV